MPLTRENFDAIRKSLREMTPEQRREFHGHVQSVRRDPRKIAIVKRGLTRMLIPAGNLDQALQFMDYTLANWKD